MFPRQAALIASASTAETNGGCPSQPRPGRPLMWLLIKFDFYAKLFALLPFAETKRPINEHKPYEQNQNLSASRGLNLQLELRRAQEELECEPTLAHGATKTSRFDRRRQPARNHQRSCRRQPCHDRLRPAFHQGPEEWRAAQDLGNLGS
jgi:hypothetical protein